MPGCESACFGDVLRGLLGWIITLTARLVPQYRRRATAGAIAGVPPQQRLGLLLLPRGSHNCRWAHAGGRPCPHRPPGAGAYALLRRAAPAPLCAPLVLADLCLALYQMMNASSPVWHAARVLAPRTRGATAFIQIPCCRGARRAGPATGHAASERRRVCRGERGHRAVHGSSSDGAMSVRARNAVKSSARLCVTELMRVCTTAARRWL
jgi:hypothetical protein